VSRRLGHPIPGYRLGETGVQLFFVLSGYLMTRSVLSARFTPRRYIVNRVLRILPAYYAAILVVIAFVDSSTLTSARGLRILGEHLLLIENVFREGRQNLIIGVLWTLSIEWMFYALILLCAPLLRRRRYAWIVVGSMLVGAVVYKAVIWERYHTARGLSDQVFFYKQLPGMADQFACGMIIALLVTSPSARRWVTSHTAAVAALLIATVGLVAGGALYVRHDGFTYFTERNMALFWPLLFCGSAALLLLGLTHFESRLAPWVKWSGLGLVGAISYSLYLLHVVVIQALETSHRDADNPLPFLPYAVVIVVVVFAASAACYWFVERPAMRLRKKAP
jgi:peptidoglycan/LPS O-acetylase OafA/YrhL